MDSSVVPEHTPRADDLDAFGFVGIDQKVDLITASLYCMTGCRGTSLVRSSPSHQRMSNVVLNL